MNHLVLFTFTVNLNTRLRSHKIFKHNSMYTRRKKYEKFIESQNEPVNAYIFLLYYRTGIQIDRSMFSVTQVL